jgi:hypothetical protein
MLALSRMGSGRSCQSGTSLVSVRFTDDLGFHFNCPCGSQRNKSGQAAKITVAASRLKPSFVLSSQVVHWCFPSSRPQHEKTKSKSACADRSTILSSSGTGCAGPGVSSSSPPRYLSHTETACTWLDCMAGSADCNAPLLPSNCNHSLGSHWWRNCNRN